MYRIREHSDGGIPYLIDNREGTPNLSSVLRTLMASGEWADIATGYLSLSGYRMLADSLEALRDFRLLFGQSQIADELARELRLSELQQLMATHELAQDTNAGLAPVSETLTRDDLHLVCWMLVR